MMPLKLMFLVDNWDTKRTLFNPKCNEVSYIHCHITINQSSVLVKNYFILIPP